MNGAFFNNSGAKTVLFHGEKLRQLVYGRGLGGKRWDGRFSFAIDECYPVDKLGIELGQTKPLLYITSQNGSDYGSTMLMLLWLVWLPVQTIHAGTFIQTRHLLTLFSTGPSAAFMVNPCGFSNCVRL